MRPENDNRLSFCHYCKHCSWTSNNPAPIVFHSCRPPRARQRMTAAAWFALQTGGDHDDLETRLAQLREGTATS